MWSLSSVQNAPFGQNTSSRFFLRFYFSSSTQWISMAGHTSVRFSTHCLCAQKKKKEEKRQRKLLLSLDLPPDPTLHLCPDISSNDAEYTWPFEMWCITLFLNHCVLLPMKWVCLFSVQMVCGITWRRRNVNRSVLRTTPCRDIRATRTNVSACRMVWCEM